MPGNSLNNLKKESGSLPLTKKHSLFSDNIYVQGLLISLALLGIFVLSELIYLYFNRPQILSGFMLLNSQYFAKKSESGIAKKFLVSGAKIHIGYNSRKYSDFIHEPYSPDFKIEEDSELEKAFLDYITVLDLQKVREEKEYDISRVFYQLGLVANRLEEKNIFRSMLQTAVYLNPELSHYHVELVNYYLFYGDTDKAENALNFCFKFTSPIKHCHDYKDNVFDINAPEKPGFLEEEVAKYYQANGQAF